MKKEVKCKILPMHNHQMKKKRVWEWRYNSTHPFGGTDRRLGGPQKRSRRGDEEKNGKVKKEMTKEREEEANKQTQTTRETKE